MSEFRFELLATDGAARTGVIHTPRGKIRTPAFMPVGTAATVKAMLPQSVRETGADILLGNTYHLMLRPGAERVARLGGLHKFMDWPRPILTDSGGFQVMSLSALRKISEEGVRFQSHIDGHAEFLSPERAMEIQRQLGSDIQMVFDECPALPATHAAIEKSMALSMRWAKRSKAAFGQQTDEEKLGRACFGIVQGGTFADLRARSAEAPGLAGGGPRWIGRILARRRQAEVSIARMQALTPGAAPLALTARPAERVRNALPAEPLRSLEARGLSYRYPGGERGIADIDLTVRKGEFLVITGPAGAGKTTLLRCLLGLLPSDVGEIRWNGEPVAEPAAFMIPPRTAYTPQAPRLFSESLGDNIAMGHAASDAEIMAAAELAVLDEDIAGFSAGLRAPVGTRGVTLSGGQVQRAAAARMFVRGAQLMVFDDLSSALDVETEQRLWRGLGARGDFTCLAVSHRREAFRRADHILVMDHGRVVARGSLDQLLAAGGLFASLWGEQG